MQLCTASYEVAHWTRSLTYIKQKLSAGNQDALEQLLDLNTKLVHAQEQLEYVSSSEYIAELQGTLGADPLEGSKSSQL